MALQYGVLLRNAKLNAIDTELGATATRSSGHRG
jgi:hypothetical protein